MLEPVDAHGGSVLFVQLTCEREELLGVPGKKTAESCTNSSMPRA
jgi:hypothetical protein